MPKPNFNDLLADALRVRTLRLLRVDAGQRREVVARLRRLSRELLKEVAATDFGTRPEIQQVRVRTLLATAEALIRNVYRDIRTFTAKELAELAGIEAEYARSSVNRLAGFGLMGNRPPDEVLASLAAQVVIEGSPAAEWWSRQAGDYRQRFAALVVQGVASGTPVDDMVRDLLKGTREIDRRAVRNAEALVRTGVQKVATDARIETYRANRDVVKGLTQISTLDGRTTITCVSYDNAAWTLDFEPIAPSTLPWNGGPPRHFNCRSTTTPLTRSWAELGLEGEDPDPGVRASMTGDIPADKTFDQWLSERPEDFQDDLLGEGKAAIWRKNKSRMSLKDLVDQDGRPLTLAQLKRLYPDS